MPTAPVRNTLGRPAQVMPNAGLLFPFPGPVWTPEGRWRENGCAGKKATHRCPLPVTKVLSLSIRTEVSAQCRPCPALPGALCSRSTPSTGEERAAEDESAVRNEGSDLELPWRRARLTRPRGARTAGGRAAWEGTQLQLQDEPGARHRRPRPVCPSPKTSWRHLRSPGRGGAHRIAHLACAVWAVGPRSCSMWPVLVASAETGWGMPEMSPRPRRKAETRAPVRPFRGGRGRPRWRCLQVGAGGGGLSAAACVSTGPWASPQPEPLPAASVQRSPDPGSHSCALGQHPQEGRGRSSHPVGLFLTARLGGSRRALPLHPAVHLRDRRAQSSFPAGRWPSRHSQQ